MTRRDELKAMAEVFLGEWNTQDVERVVALYTSDLAYRDPNTRGEIRSADAMRRYLTKLFAAWKMHWGLRDLWPLEGEDGAAILWRASFQRSTGGPSVHADGMDLVLLDGRRARRNEVYFDRGVLASLL